MTTVATICARGGSRGVPRKNVRPLLGKPLIVHTIEQALRCPGIDSVYVSTDDDEIAEVARRAGAQVPFRRPAELASDTAAKLPAIRHLVAHLEASMTIDKVVDLDPTSPLRRVEDITRCLELLVPDVDLVITGYLAEKNPYFNMVEQQPDGNWRLVKTLPGGVSSRQQAPIVYSMNASIYAWNRAALEHGIWECKVRFHEMPRERSIDIDSLLDWRLVELLMKEATAS